MTEAASVPGPAAASDGVPSQAALWRGQGALSDEDVLALLDGLGVAGTHDPEDEQEAILAAEIAAREADAPREADAAREADSLSTCGHGLGRADQDRQVRPLLVAEHLPAGPGLAAVLAQDPPDVASDWDLPGLASGYRKLAAWAQARELAAAAEIATRRAAANPRIRTDETGRPASLPPEAAAEVALELVMSQYGAAAWTSLGCRLRWDLPSTGAALAAGTIDLPRARIIAEATVGLSGEHAAQVEARVLPRAADQTTGQLRAAVRRAVLAVDPEGAEQRRRDTERLARVGLYPGEEGTATLAGSSLPGVQAAAAMARITAIARALKSSGANGGLDLLRAHVFIGLLLGTLPFIPPPHGDDEPPDDDGGAPQNDVNRGSSPDADDSPDADGLGDDGDPHYGQPPGGDEGPGRHSHGGHSHSGHSHSGHSDGGHGHGDEPAVPASPATDAQGGSRCGAGRGQEPRAEDDVDDLPGWWPDIPPPGDTDAPPEPGDPPEPTTSHPDDDDIDDDWPQLPPPDWPPLPAQLPAPPDPAPSGGDGARLSRTGLLDVHIPWTTLTGRACEPATLGRVGPVTSRQTFQLLALATRSSATQWRVVTTDDLGRALAVGRARPGWQIHPGDTDRNVTGTVGRITIAIRASHVGTPAAEPGSDSPVTVQQIAPMILAAAARELEHARHDTGATATCGHTMAPDAYRPPPRMREWVAARDCTCRFGPCGQPAWRTDLDHTVPWHRGGPTCPCNLGGCCRTHHRIKQLPGWHLEQPQPGTFRWTTPAGRSYLVEPDLYPV
jgi:Domain of unknown function (DUF222)